MKAFFASTHKMIGQPLNPSEACVEKKLNLQLNVTKKNTFNAEDITWVFQEKKNDLVFRIPSYLFSKSLLLPLWPFNKMYSPVTWSINQSIKNGKGRLMMERHSFLLLAQVINAKRVLHLKFGSVESWE